MYNMFKGLCYDQCIDLPSWLCIDHVKKKKNSRGMILLRILDRFEQATGCQVVAL